MSEKENLHEYRDKNGNLVRVRKSSSGEVYIDQYDGTKEIRRITQEILREFQVAMVSLQGTENAKVR